MLVNETVRATKRTVEDACPYEMPPRAAKRSRPTTQTITTTQAAGMVRTHAGGASSAPKCFCTRVTLAVC